MKQGIFVTEIDKFDIQSSLINSCFNDKYYKDSFQKVKQEFPEMEWQVCKLNEILSLQTAPDLIILSRNAFVYKDSISYKFPHSNIKVLDTWSSN